MKISENMKFEKAALILWFHLRDQNNMPIKKSVCILSLPLYYLGVSQPKMFAFSE